MLSSWQLAGALVLAAATAPRAPAGEPAWAEGATCYVVSVQSFYDANGDGVGDLQGLRQKLDYLNDGDPATTTDLGVDAIALLPITPSGTLLGVDPLDTRNVEPALGTLSDLDALVADAHARGLRVLLSLVINHTSDHHPWFARALSGDEAMRARYRFRPDDPGWKQPFDATRPVWHTRPEGTYYGLWWDGTPDLALERPEVKSELFETLAFWLDRGLDGLVLESVRYLVEGDDAGSMEDSEGTFALVREVRASIAATHPEALIVLEVLAPTGPTGRYHAACVNEPLPRTAVLDAALEDRIVEGVRRGSGHEITRELAEMARVLPAGALDGVLLSHYKRNRVGRALRRERARMGNAAAVQLTLPGLAFVYYGDELGLTVLEEESDASKRSPLPWTSEEPGHGFTTGPAFLRFAEGAAEDNVAIETASPSSLLARYRALIRARRTSPALQHGSLTLVTPTERASPLVAYVRRAGTEAVLVVHNVADTPAALRRVDLGDGTPVPLWLDGGVGAPVQNEAGWDFVMPPRASGIWQLDETR